METTFSVCGAVCAECDYFKNAACVGCAAIQGKVWWASYIGASVCPVYHCVVHENHLPHCGACADLPCQLWRDLKDPAYTDEQHATNIQQRVKNLHG
jgi:hypothetical protein